MNFRDFLETYINLDGHEKRSQSGTAALEKWASTINLEGKRIHLSKSEMSSVVNMGQHLPAGYYRTNGKPYGLWYGLGSRWIEFILFEHPRGTADYIYEIDILKPKMLFISSEDQAREVEKQYGVWKDFDKHNWGGSPPMQRTILIDKTVEERPKMIDWGKAGRDYFGIELDPQKVYARWTEDWAVPSGCVWNKRGITRMKLIAKYDPARKQFVSQ